VALTTLFQAQGFDGEKIYEMFMFSLGAGAEDNM